MEEDLLGPAPCCTPIRPIGKACWLGRARHRVAHSSSPSWSPDKTHQLSSVNTESEFLLTHFCQASTRTVQLAERSAWQLSLLPCWVMPASVSAPQVPRLFWLSQTALSHSHIGIFFLENRSDQKSLSFLWLALTSTKIHMDNEQLWNDPQDKKHDVTFRQKSAVLPRCHRIRDSTLSLILSQATLNKGTRQLHTGLCVMISYQSEDESGSVTSCSDLVCWAELVAP